jgi:hypothetical protein
MPDSSKETSIDTKSSYTRNIVNVVYTLNKLNVQKSDVTFMLDTCRDNH